MVGVVQRGQISPGGEQDGRLLGQHCRAMAAVRGRACCKSAWGCVRGTLAGCSGGARGGEPCMAMRSYLAGALSCIHQTYYIVLVDIMATQCDACRCERADFSREERFSTTPLCQKPATMHVRHASAAQWRCTRFIHCLTPASLCLRLRMP